MRILKTFSVIFAAFAVIAFVATVVLRVLGADEEAPMISMDSEQISISVGDGEDRILAGQCTGYQRRRCDRNPSGGESLKLHFGRRAHSNNCGFRYRQSCF